MPLMPNTDTPEQADERRRVNAATAQRLYHAANLADRLSKLLRDGGDFLRNERAADGGPLVPDAEQVAASSKMLAYLQRLEAFIEHREFSLPGQD